MTTLAIAGIMHESNTFSGTPTDAAAFSQTHASNIIKTWGEAHHEISGFIPRRDTIRLYDLSDVHGNRHACRTRDGRCIRPDDRDVNPAPQSRTETRRPSPRTARPPWPSRVIPMAMVRSYDGSGKHSGEIFQSSLRLTNTPTSPSRWPPNRPHS